MGPMVVQTDRVHTTVVTTRDGAAREKERWFRLHQIDLQYPVLNRVQGLNVKHPRILVSHWLIFLGPRSVIGGIV